MGRKTKGKCAAFVRLAVNGEGEVVMQGDLLDDRQSQARPPGVAGTGLIHPIEPFRETGDMFGRDADARIVHRKNTFPPLFAPGQCDLSSRRGITDRIGHQIAEGAHEFRFDSQQGALIEMAMGIESMLPLAQLADHLQHLGEQGRKGNGDERRNPGLAFQTGQGEQFFHQSAHAVGLGFHGLKDAFPGSGWKWAAVLQGFDEPPQHGEGGAQFMGDIGHEIAPHLFVPFPLGDVLSDQHAFVGTVRDELQGQGEILLGASMQDAAMVRGGFLVQEILELGLADEIRQALSPVLLQVNL